MKTAMAKNLRLPAIKALLAICVATGAGCFGAESASESAPPKAPTPLGDTIHDPDRSFRDFGFSAENAPENAAALRLRLAGSLPRESIRAATVYLKSGEGWHAAAIGATDAICAGGNVRVPLQSFSAEGNPDPIGKSTAIRIAAWKRAGFTNEIVLAEAAFDAPARIAIVRPTERTAPGETAFAAEMADRCAAIVAKTGRDFDFIGDEDFAKIGASLVFLPYSPNLGASDAKALAAFAEKGGKLIVFCCGNKELGKALGVEPGPWRSSGKRAFTAMDCEPLLGETRRIPHFTEGVVPPLPIPGSGAKKIATWVTEYVKPTRHIAATLAPRGAWFAHVPPRAYPAAVAFMEAIMADLGEPQHREEVAARCERPQPSDGVAARCEEKAKVKEALPRLAAWANAPEIPAAYGERLAELGLETLYVRRKPTDASAPAKIPGIAVHAWISCFTTEGLPPETLERLKREKRLSASNPGWMEPTVKANGEITIKQLVAAAKSGVAGIHLDYVRTSSDTPQSAETTAAITEFVREASKAVRKANPKIILSAAVFATPESAARHNQDWPAWLAEGLVDYVCPMTYTESPGEFAGYLDACLAAAPAGKLRPGIGTGANESQTGAATTAAELEETAKAGCPEAIFFTLNDSLIEVLEALGK